MKALIAVVALAASSLVLPGPAEAQEEAVPSASLVAPGGQPAGLPMGLDARSVASDAEVGAARRAYRAQCQRVESRAFCDCVTAGVAQSLAPGDLRLAARTVRERISAEGDAPISYGDDAESRISQVEAQYANTCVSYR